MSKLSVTEIDRLIGKRIQQKRKELRLNEKNCVLKPRPMTVINYWFTKDEEPRINHVHVAQKGMHSVVSWDGEEWHLGDLKIVPDNEE